jgi:hypothetical protein
MIRKNSKQQFMQLKGMLDGEFLYLFEGAPSFLSCVLAASYSQGILSDKGPIVNPAKCCYQSVVDQLIQRTSFNQTGSLVGEYYLYKHSDPLIIGGKNTGRDFVASLRPTGRGPRHYRCCLQTLNKLMRPYGMLRIRI